MHRINASGQTAVANAEPERAPALTRSGMTRKEFDDDYVSRLIAGDADVERHFFDYFSTLLGIKLRSRLRNQSQIDDVRQETLLRVLLALKRRNSLQDAAKLGAFVNSVCNNLLFELYRRESKHKTIDIEGHDPLDSRSDAESELVTEERRREVRQVLGELPVKDRELLRMIFFEDAGRDDICRSFHVDREYLRVLVHRAKERFRDLLRKHNPEFAN